DQRDPLSPRPRSPQSVRFSKAQPGIDTGDHDQVPYLDITQSVGKAHKHAREVVVRADVEIIQEGSRNIARIYPIQTESSHQHQQALAELQQSYGAKRLQPG